MNEKSKAKGFGLPGTVDVLVCGGGPAGIAAALVAARSGARVLLVERYGRLGGMAVNGMVGLFMGHVRSAWVDSIVDFLGGRTIDYEFADIRYAELLESAGADFLLHATVVEPMLENGRVTGARLLTGQGLHEVRAKVTVDASGDGQVAWTAGADFEQGREAGPDWPGDGLVQPMSIMFRVSGVDSSLTMEARGGRANFRFADGRSWKDVTLEANARGELPPEVGLVRTYPGQRLDERMINATQVNHLDGTSAPDLTRAEIVCRRQARQILTFLKKAAPGYQNAFISGMPAVIGVRETRRIKGVYRLELEDLISGLSSPRAVVRQASFIVDIHNPDGIGQARTTSENPLGRDLRVKPYDIPFDCLVPRCLDGLLTAGRCISASHEALASCRVQIISFATGVAAGAAAALAAREKSEPRQVDVAEVQKIAFASSISLGKDR